MLMFLMSFVYSFHINFHRIFGVKSTRVGLTPQILWEYEEYEWANTCFRKQVRTCLRKHVLASRR